jgi:methylglutaconyl-CoA hydratase
MLKIEQNGPVLYVRLNRPEVRNAFNEALIAQIHEVFSTVSRDIRAIVLSGEGASFCAGGDLEWMRAAAGYSVEENERDALKLAKMFAAIRDCHAVTIANVHGGAFGGGAGLVAAVDIAISTEETKFAFSEVKLGLIPATISSFVIPKISAGHARALFATGEIFSASHALSIGLVHEISKQNDREAVINRKLRAILSAGPDAIYQAKKLVLDAPLSLEETAKRLAQVRAGEEAKEGIGAFLDKRTASFVTLVPEQD